MKVIQNLQIQILLMKCKEDDRIRLLSSDSEESDVKTYLDWTEFDEPANNEAFQGIPGFTVFLINTSMT